MFLTNFIIIGSRICKRLLLLFLYMIFVLLIRIFLISGDFSFSVFIMLCHYILFYGTYVGKVVGKATRECGCCMSNIDIKCYVILRETFSKWRCKFMYYIGLS